MPIFVELLAVAAFAYVAGALLAYLFGLRRRSAAEGRW
jgi:hypothetical protein